MRLRLSAPIDNKIGTRLWSRSKIGSSKKAPAPQHGNFLTCTESIYLPSAREITIENIIMYVKDLSINNANVTGTLTVDTITKSLAIEVCIIGDFAVGSRLLVDTIVSNVASQLDILVKRCGWVSGNQQEPNT